MDIFKEGREVERVCNCPVVVDMKEFLLLIRFDSGEKLLYKEYAMGE
jgi:hypothetical protein